MLVFTGAAAHGAPANSLFRGSAAFADTRHAVSFGERPSGSVAIQKLRDWMVSELKPTGAQVSLDPFSGRTPDGVVSMANVIAKFPGTSGKAVAITGHFDTKKIAGVHFLGANDAGSSTGFLLEFARAIAKVQHKDDIYIIFFDGEEAVLDWTETDSCYGSRHLATKWLADGTLGHLVALINVDMIGDKDLDIQRESNSTGWLVLLMGQAARKFGYERYFFRQEESVEDDHLAFVERGVPSIDVIDLDYGPNNSYHHTAQDTMDKVSAKSLTIDGDVFMETIRLIDLR